MTVPENISNAVSAAREAPPGRHRPARRGWQPQLSSCLPELVCAAVAPPQPQCRRRRSAADALHSCTHAASHPAAHTVPLTPPAACYRGWREHPLSLASMPPSCPPWPTLSGAPADRWCAAWDAARRCCAGVASAGASAAAAASAVALPAAARALGHPRAAGGSPPDLPLLLAGSGSPHPGHQAVGAVAISMITLGDGLINVFGELQVGGHTSAAAAAPAALMPVTRQAGPRLQPSAAKECQGRRAAGGAALRTHLASRAVAALPPLRCRTTPTTRQTPKCRTRSTAPSSRCSAVRPRVGLPPGCGGSSGAAGAGRRRRRSDRR